MILLGSQFGEPGLSYSMGKDSSSDILVPDEGTLDDQAPVSHFEVLSFQLHCDLMLAQGTRFIGRGNTGSDHLGFLAAAIGHGRRTHRADYKTI